MKLVHLVILTVLLLVPMSAPAQFAKLVHYQGVLESSDGSKFSGTTDLTFNLYTRPLAEEPFWSEVHTNVAITDGNYDVMLGSQNPLQLSFYEYFLEVQAEGMEVESDRTMIVGSGYNLRLWHLFSAYTFTAVAIFLYLFSVNRRQKKIITELETLKSPE